LNAYLSWRKVRKIANRAGTSANVVPGAEEAEEDATIADEGKHNIISEFGLLMTYLIKYIQAHRMDGPK
jgi:hypothetical protein